MSIKNEARKSQKLSPGSLVSIDPTGTIYIVSDDAEGALKDLDTAIGTVAGNSADTDFIIRKTATFSGTISAGASVTIPDASLGLGSTDLGSHRIHSESAFLVKADIVAFTLYAGDYYASDYIAPGRALDDGTLTLYANSITNIFKRLDPEANTENEKLKILLEPDDSASDYRIKFVLDFSEATTESFSEGLTVVVTYRVTLITE